MQCTENPILFGYPVFVVWKTVHFPNKPFIRKRRVVVDIRGLNKISESDVYPMPFQSNVISAVQGAKYIIVVDCTGFFHQWPVKRENQYKLIVVSHRNNEQWNMVVIKFKNNPAYVQKQINGLLKPFDFIKTYVDDVIIFNRTLKDHANHFHEIFGLFDKMNIALKPSKSYIGYPTMMLLGQKIDNFGLNIAKCVQPTILF